MIVDVINQTICTVHKHLIKEISLTQYGVDCDRGLWKPYLKSYLLQTVYESSCAKAYNIDCEINELSSNLVTEKVCTSAANFANKTCSGTITLSTVTTIEPCREGTIVLINS